MNEIVLATRNPGKVREMDKLLKPLNLIILSLLNFPGLPELPEDGETYRENASQKARLAAEWTGKVALADDSGLEVDALGGEPGVKSARFLGEGTSQERKNQRLLDLLEGVPPEGSGARFVCTLAIATPEGNLFLCEGVCSGRIAEQARGEEGFGYDPIFLLPSFRATMAELDLSLKNRMSHRGQAFQQAHKVLIWIFSREKDDGQGEKILLPFSASRYTLSQKANSWFFFFLSSTNLSEFIVDRQTWGYGLPSALHNHKEIEKEGSHSMQEKIDACEEFLAHLRPLLRSLPLDIEERELNGEN